MSNMRFYIITLILFLILFDVNGQDENILNLSLNTTYRYYSDGYNGSNIYHNPTKTDKKNIRRWKKLLYQQPNEENFSKYYKLACSFWEVSQLNNAKIMFLSIFNSSNKYFNDTYYYNGSGTISTDSSTTLGYGGFSYNYKNEVCNYLTKIYIEQQKFDSALCFLDIAENKYPVTFTCGTSYYFQRNEQLFLRTTCYYGLKKYQEITDLLLPYALKSSHLDELSFSIKQLYSPDSIQKMLVTAEESIECVTIETGVLECLSYDDNGNSIDSLVYYPCYSTIKLFGKELFVPIPDKDIKHGERITKERMQKEFRNSLFYHALMKKDNEDSD